MAGNVILSEAKDLFIHGAPGPIRTADTGFRRAVLCPLSYGGAWGLFYQMGNLARGFGDGQTIHANDVRGNLPI